MADRKQTKAERRQANAGAEADEQNGDQQLDAQTRQAKAEAKAERKKARGGGQRTRDERRQARQERKQRAGPAGAGPEDASPPPAEIESRLARIEEAVASQSERSEELLGKLDEVLHEARKSARHAKSAVTQSGEGG